MFTQVTVPENSISGTTVAWVEAFDRDSSLYGSEGIRYTTLGGSIADKYAQYYAVNFEFLYGFMSNSFL